MKKIIKSVYFSLLLGLLFGIPANLYANNSEWNYSDDASGPKHWATISTEYSLCGNGKNQSPVNIDSKKTADGQLSGIKFNYGLILPQKIENTGKLIRVSVASGKGTNINANGVEFELKYLDFHIPSEHTLDGKHYPMEIQFAHESKDKKLAYVSMMAVPGRLDRTLRKLLEQLPMKTGESNPLASNALRNTEMKKKLANYYHYSGSSTKPPCTEGAHWFIMKQPITISKEQYQNFKSAIKQDNNRPVQSLNARIIVE